MQENPKEIIHFDINNIELLRNALNTCFQKVMKIYEDNGENYCIQMNIGTPLLYKRFLKTGAYKISDKKTPLLVDFLINQLESALNSSDELVINRDLVIHIIVTYIPKNFPFPRGKLDNNRWKSHVGSKNTLTAWKKLGTLSNSDFGYKIR